MRYSSTAQKWMVPGETPEASHPFSVAPWDRRENNPPGHRNSWDFSSDFLVIYLGYSMIWLFNGMASLCDVTGKTWFSWDINEIMRILMSIPLSSLQQTMVYGGCLVGRKGSRIWITLTSFRKKYGHITYIHTYIYIQWNLMLYGCVKTPNLHFRWDWKHRSKSWTASKMCLS